MKRPPKILETLTDRDFFPVWLIQQGLTGTMVEIGTYYGNYAAHLLRNWPGKVITVDPFQNGIEGYIDGCVRGLDMAEVYEVAKMNLKEWLQTGRCLILTGFSVQVATQIPTESLDAVYCDGDHSYEAITADIEAWWPKIKPGGVLGGHDLYSRADNLQHADVANAVLDFAEKLGVRPRLTPCSSWWFVKQ